MFPCKVCENTEGNNIHAAREMMFGTRDPFDYLECGTCGTVQILKVPDLSKHYPDNYLAFESDVPLARSLKRRIIAWFAGKIFLTGKDRLGKFILSIKPGFYKYLPPSMREYQLGLRANSRILDFGCGSGSLLLTLQYFGFTNLTGADAFIKEDISYSTGLRIYRRRLEEFDGPFDLVMLHHSFEHLADPLSTLKQIRRLLGNNGTCLVRIPLVGFAWEKYGINWVQLDAPRHLFLYTKGSFCKLAQQAGLNVENVTYDSSSFQFWGSEQYIQDIPLTDDRSYWKDPSTTIFTVQQIEKWQKQAVELNATQRGDMACFYLRAA